MKKKIFLVLVVVLLLCMSVFATIKKPPTGFGSIKFGDKPEQIKGLVEDTAASAYTIYKICTIPGEELSFGGVKLGEVHYYFGHRGFNQAQVSIWGDENIEKIEKECTRRWGKPERVKNSTAIAWSSEKGSAVIIYLSLASTDGKTKAHAVLRVWDESRP